MLNKILSWLKQAKIWKFVSLTSSITGLLFYSLSSSFNNLFGKWNLFKIFVYTVFSLIICLAILFANTCHTSSLKLKTHLVFSVFTATTLYSFFFDKVNGKPDLYSLVSCASFAIMSLSLSKHTQLGFEVDLLYFFCGYLTLQLMKIKLFLVFVGVSFSYSLIILRFYLCNSNDSGHLRVQFQDQNCIVIQVHADLEESQNVNLITPQENMDFNSVTQMNSLSSQQGNSDAVKLVGYERALFMMNEKLNRVIWKQFMTIRQEVFSHSKSKIMGIDDIIDNLHNIVKAMVEDEFETECCKVYNIFRRRFMNKCLCRLGLQEVNLCDVENENIENLISDFNIALRILLPNERRVWNHIFSMYSFEHSIFSSLEWRRMEIELWAKFMVLETRIHGNSSHEFVHDSGVHPLTREVMKCIKDVCKDHRDVVAHFQIIEMIQLLESNLDAKSKINKNSALGYLFMLNNYRYIQLEARYVPLVNILGKEWTQIQTSKIRRNIKHYIKCSWNKVLNLLENDESMTTNVAIESMRLFHINFSDICKAQSKCFVIDERLRKTMRKYLKNMLLPLYENFIGRIQDVVGKDVADQYIKYGMSDIEDRINHLFLEMKETTPVTGHHSH